MSLCLPGLQGFPIQVSGWISTADKNSFVVPSDISLQFSPTELPMIYNQTQGSFTINGQNTFFIGGSQYFVKAIRICSPKQTGLSILNPIAEFHIWGYPTATSTNQKSIALLNIPVFQGVQNTKTGDTFIELLANRPVRLDKIIPTGNDINIVRYSSCVETQNNTINIVTAYWEKGITIEQNVIKNIPQPLKEFGIPSLGSFKLLSSFVISENGKTERIYTEKDGIQQAYPKSISASSSDFTNSFRYIKGFIELSLSSSKYDTSAYKCITIDPSRDIKNGKILIDPESGKRLSESVKDADDQANDKQEARITPNDIMEVIAVIMGFILGLTMIFAIFYFIYTFFTTRKSTGDLPMDPKVAAAINAVGTIAGSSKNT